LFCPKRVMATPKPISPYKKPSTLLGFLLLGVLLIFAIFLGWQTLWLEECSSAKLKPEHLLGAGGVASAMCGWIIAGMITLRNSIRQHTVTTLLQSRLSATYMKYADDLSRHYTEFDKRRRANPALRESATDKVDISALRYILNYFEFIAIGVKRGDLDEETLKDSLRSILRKNVAMSRPWIKAGQVDNPHLYTNLLWLHDRWMADLEREKVAS